MTRCPVYLSQRKTSEQRVRKLSSLGQPGTYCKFTRAYIIVLQCLTCIIMSIVIITCLVMLKLKELLENRGAGCSSHLAAGCALAWASGLHVVRRPAGGLLHAQHSA